MICTERGQQEREIESQKSIAIMQIGTTIVIVVWVCPLSTKAANTTPIRKTVHTIGHDCIMQVRLETVTDYQCSDKILFWKFLRLRTDNNEIQYS